MVKELREHVFHPAQIPLIDKLEANIKASKARLDEKFKSGHWRVIP